MTAKGLYIYCRMFKRKQNIIVRLQQILEVRQHQYRIENKCYVGYTTGRRHFRSDNVHGFWIHGKHSLNALHRQCHIYRTYQKIYIYNTS